MPRPRLRALLTIRAKLESEKPQSLRNRDRARLKLTWFKTKWGIKEDWERR